MLVQDRCYEDSQIYHWGVRWTSVRNSVEKDRRFDTGLYSGSLSSFSFQIIITNHDELISNGFLYSWLSWQGGKADPIMMFLNLQMKSLYSLKFLRAEPNDQAKRSMMFSFSWRLIEPYWVDRKQFLDAPMANNFVSSPEWYWNDGMPAILLRVVVKSRLFGRGCWRSI